MERAGIDPVADRVSDGIGLAKQPARGRKQPSKQQQSRSQDQETLPGVAPRPGDYSRLFHVARPISTGIIESFVKKASK
jgi:hypothetical protein